MPAFTDPLSNLRVASPCPADWEQMFGNERVKFCGECKLNVYNLSGMTRDEAESLIINTEGRLCVRFYRRRDGSILTQDCPVGWAKVKHRARLFTTAAASLLMSLLTGVFFAQLFSRNSTPSPIVMGAIPMERNREPELYPIQGNVAMPIEVKGEMLVEDVRKTPPAQISRR
ncbi:MAG: hypothetical protein IPM50_08365 [Acidobacteriota bacterium]|nr:MAG: hypothetical protein IPM50_08365 [Acidobacteriota bacterium]